MPVTPRLCNDHEPSYYLLLFFLALSHQCWVTVLARMWSRGHSLCIGRVSTCSLAARVSTNAGKTDPLDIDIASVIWKCNNTMHSQTFHGTLFWPESPVDVISVTQLVQDNKDSTIIGQHFDYNSIFSWDNGSQHVDFDMDHPVSRWSICMTVQYQILVVSINLL